MRNGRRRMHGGRSTGPRTPEGLERALARRAGSMASDQRRPCSDIDSTASSSSCWAGPREVELATKLWNLIKFKNEAG
jgi:hypothetical protein